MRVTSIRTATKLLLSLVILVCPIMAVDQQSSPPPGQGAGGAQAAEPKFRVVRSVSGSKGSQQGGRYIVEDPRTVFYTPEDRQVIVYFEWEGPTGLHRFEGLWKNPGGKVIVVSDFQYEATQKRFASYWTLILSEALPTGVWTLEARIDGEVAGAHTFQIAAAPRPSLSDPARVPLNPSAIYQRALAATLSIEKLRASGERHATASGFLLAGGWVVTAFQAIDGASTLRLLLPDGRRLEIAEVLAWNRWQDWAVLRIDSGAASPLQQAKPDSWAVGDRCFFLDVASEGNRVIADVNIVGENNFPGAGRRLNLTVAPSQAAVGSPLLNEYGEVIGLVGGSLVPGASSLEALRFSYPIERAGTTGVIRGGLVVPLTVIPTPSAEARPTSLAELARTGQFVPLLVANKHVGFGTLAQGLERRGNAPPWPMEGRDEFSHRDAKMTVFVMWEPKEKLKRGVASLRVYDVNNRLLAQGKPAKVSMKPTDRAFSTWEVPLAGLLRGTYRVDVLLGPDLAWRAFFRVVE